MASQLREPVFLNKILRMLPNEEIRLIRPTLTRVRLIRGQILYEPGEDLAQQYFIEEGVVSLVTPLESFLQQVDIGIVGSESILGVNAAIQLKPISFQGAIVQMPGYAYTMPVSATRSFVQRLPEFKELLFQALNSAFAQLSLETACQRSHSLSERLARRLLVARRLVRSDTLEITHEAIARMLSVRRPGVTVALSCFESAGFIRQSRGRIYICDPQGLTAAACRCETHLRDLDAAHTCQSSAHRPSAVTVLPHL